ncbi:MAG: P-II family nitrogen regulator [Nocardioides sp.]
MHFKLIVVIVEDADTEALCDTARREGATGSTVISQARGEGVAPATTFFGLGLEASRDVILLVVEQHLSRRILEAIARAGRFDEQPGRGIAFQVDVEDAVGVLMQANLLKDVVEEEL